MTLSPYDAMLTALEAVGRYAAFAGRAFVAAALAVTRPRESLCQFHAVLIGALPLAVVAGLALGLVVWMHTRGVLARIGGPGSVAILPTLLALAVVLELSPIGAGLIVAGRAGASLGAELGSMRLTEQIDALEVLGHSAMRELVGPRVLACVLTLPILTVFMDYLALVGSFAAEAGSSGMTWLQYAEAYVSRLQFLDVLLGTLKTLVFGYLVGVAGCYFGMTADGGTEGVGRAATRAVVAATVSVLVANVLLVRLFQFVA
jgi:phospholipid/cholesterol/gamma-HCH transport system permease protein